MYFFEYSVLNCCIKLYYIPRVGLVIWSHEVALVWSFGMTDEVSAFVFLKCCLKFVNDCTDYCIASICHFRFNLF